MANSAWKETETNIEGNLKKNPDDMQSVYKELDGLKQKDSSHMKENLSQINDELHRNGYLPKMQLSEEGDHWTVKPCEDKCRPEDAEHKAGGAKAEDKNKDGKKSDDKKADGKGPDGEKPIDRFQDIHIENGQVKANADSHAGAPPAGHDAQPGQPAPQAGHDAPPPPPGQPAPQAGHDAPPPPPGQPAPQAGHDAPPPPPGQPAPQAGHDAPPPPPGQPAPQAGHDGPNPIEPFRNLHIENGQIKAKTDAHAAPPPPPGHPAGHDAPPPPPAQPKNPMDALLHPEIPDKPALPGQPLCNPELGNNPPHDVTNGPDAPPIPENQRGALISKALKVAGVPDTPENSSAVNLIASHESTWDPNAINNWDSNAAAGHPSQGLIQAIPSTFSGCAVPGLDKNIKDPLSNIVAGIRYSVDRYGSLQDVPGVDAVNSGGEYQGY